MYQFYGNSNGTLKGVLYREVVPFSQGPVHYFGPVLGLNSTESFSMPHIPSHRFGFPPPQNLYRGYFYACNGTENSLAECRRGPLDCTIDNVDHSVAISCGNTELQGML